MGVSFGGGSSQSASNATQTQNKTFSGAQTSLQGDLGTDLSSSLAAAATGGLSPGVQAEETQAADQINTTDGGLTDRVNRMLAQRGFGASGSAGKATLQGELGRESDQTNNQANFANVQQTANGGNLLAALNYAFTQMGSSGSTSGTQDGSSSNWGANASAAFGF